MQSLEFSIMKPYTNLTCKVFTRFGGVSKKPFDSSNVGFGVGDKESDVKKNRELVLKSIGLKDIFYMKQVHKKDVFSLNSKDDLRKRPVCDALITNLKNVGLAVQTADCQAILLYDTKKEVIAAIHSGFKSSIINIISATILKMEKEFNTDPSDIVAGISPSLGFCCAEFINYKKEIPEFFWKYKDSKNHFDFWSISKEQLINAGVKKENIEISNICTKCNSDTFFSYRKANITGRFVSIIGLF